MIYFPTINNCRLDLSKISEKIPSPIKEISKLAEKSLKEGIAISVYVGISFFYATPIACSGFVLMGTVAFVGIVFFDNQKNFITQESSETADSIPARRLNCLRVYCCDMGKILALSLVDLSIRTTLVHEWGHASLLKLFFNATSKISLIPFIGGNTSTSGGSLTPIGKKLGYRLSHLLFVAGGPGFATLLACIDIVAAHCLKNSYPKLSMYLNSFSVINIANHVLYALSAFSDSSNSNDFVYLMARGIHPISAITVIILVPIAIKVLLVGIEALANNIPNVIQKL